MVSLNKKLSFVLALSALLACSRLGFASGMKTSTDQDGKPIHSSSVFPAKSSAATGTQGYNPFDNGGILYAIHIPSAATFGLVVVKDSEGWTVGAQSLIEVTFPTATVVAATPQIQDKIVRFDPPLRVYRGLSLQFTQCDAKTGAPYCGTVIYDTEP